MPWIAGGELANVIRFSVETRRTCLRLAAVVTCHLARLSRNELVTANQKRRWQYDVNEDSQSGCHLDGRQRNPYQEEPRRYEQAAIPCAYLRYHTNSF